MALAICIPVFAGSLKMNSIDTVFPKASTKATELYAVDIANLSHSQVVMLQALQGLAAQKNLSTQIYLIDSDCNKGEYNTDWYDELWLKNMDAAKHTDKSFEQVMQIMTGNLGIKNYILYNVSSNADSMNIVLSLAGTMFALPVDQSTLCYA